MTLVAWGCTPSKWQSCVQASSAGTVTRCPSFLSDDPFLSLWRDFPLRLWEARCKWGHRVGLGLVPLWAARGNFWSSEKPRVGWKCPVAGTSQYRSPLADREPLATCGC